MKPSAAVSFAIGTVLLACACHSAPLSPREALSLQDAQTRWVGRSLHSYTYETRASCFCDPIVLDWARVEVTNDTVSRVVLLADGSEVDATQRLSFPTVDQLFATIRSVQNQNLVTDVEVEFDREFGYPTLIRVEYSGNVVDAGLVRLARALSPEP